MIVQFGKYAGKSAEWVLLNHPAFVVRAIERVAGSRRLARLQDEFARLIDRFDRRPFTRPCMGSECPRPATRASVYLRTDTLRWWCEGCDPSSHAASPDKLHLLRRFRDADIYAAEYADDWVELRTLITNMARAKGLPDGAGAQAVVAFFE